ncbi:S1 family peptidase [Mangrovihabitans endophyticus]|uniref:Serine protease n=1 Tax=Mangrovihabitans endophyticus TaxID=1751298 RepID=A0A8J3BYR7_9ACTN|nr:S1 family peptidase [Mangrovihabitans endophyticus]GGK90530.1 serine protease [Mangrovihabitans endophyticus]
MQRRRIAVAAVVATGVAAAVAFTVPSMAGTTTPGENAAPRADRGDVAPQLLAAMKRDLGVDADQARARLARSAWASRVSSTLAATTGSTFGGAWLADDGMTLKIAVTDADARSRVRAAGAVPVLVERSEQALDSAKQKLDAARSAPADLTGWYVDVSTNKVVVVAQPGETEAARTFAADAGVPGDALRVQISKAQPKPLFDVRGADPYFIALAGGTARCSIGFAVTTGFVTAGHCGEPGDQTSGFNQQAQGTVEASVFPGDADMGFVQVNGDWTPQPVVNDFRGNELPVAGSTEAPVGAAVCRSGSTTGTFCGTILAKNQTVRYPEGAVTGLTRTDVCAEGGDSGGPWLSGDQAQGVTSGGSGDCTNGGETFFQPINEILATNDLTLVTAGGDDGSGGSGGDEGSGSEPPAASDCTALPVQRQGALRSRTAQAQPDGGAFRSGAGAQTACLDAPDGADFDLFLQRFTGRGFQTVARATGDGDKELTFDGRAGTYRYVVLASSGSGNYTLGFATP